MICTSSIIILGDQVKRKGMDWTYGKHFTCLLYVIFLKQEVWWMNIVMYDRSTELVKKQNVRNETPQILILPKSHYVTDNSDWLL